MSPRSRKAERSAAMTQNKPRGWLPWAVPVLIVSGWQLASSAGWLSTRVLPEPWAVVKAFWTLAASGEMWQHVVISTQRALAGFALGGGLALALGLLTGT